MYNCERCGYTSKYKQSVKSHLNRKTKCDTILSDESCESLIFKLYTTKINAEVDNLYFQPKVECKEIVTSKETIDLPLCDFGKENYNYISDETISELLQQEENIFIELINIVHFNINHPENWNYLVNDIDSKKAFIYKNKEVLNISIERSIDILLNDKKTFLLKKTKLTDDIININYYGNIM